MPEIYKEKVDNSKKTLFTKLPGGHYVQEDENVRDGYLYKLKINESEAADEFCRRLTLDTARAGMFRPYVSGGAPEALEVFVDTKIFKDNNRNTIRGEFKILVTPGKVQVFEEWLESFDNSLKIVDVKDTKVESEIPKHSLPVTGSPELPNHLTSLKSHMHTHHVDEQANSNSAMDSNHLQLDVAANAEHSMSSHDIYNLVKTAFSEIAKESNGKVAQQFYNKEETDEKCALHREPGNVYLPKGDSIATCERPVTENTPCTINIPVPIAGEVVKSMSDKLNASGLSLLVIHCPSAEALEQLINSGAKIDIKPESRFDLIERYTPPNNTQDNLDKLNQLLTKLKQQDSLHHTTQLH